MNTQDKMDLCRRLASSFRRYELYDDLVQEGMVALLETEARGNTHPETLRTRCPEEDAGLYIPSSRPPEHSPLL